MHTRTFARGLVAALLAAGAAAAEEELRSNTTGFYPIWENTGHVERSAAVRIGTTGAQVGIGDFAQAGVQPINFIMRSPNGYFKASLLASEDWHVAAQAGVYRLLEGASRAMFSPMYSSRLDNPDFAVTMASISLSASTDPARWLEIHQTLTALGTAAPGHLRTSATFGYSVVAELNPRLRHGITLHASEVGFWAHDLALAGAAYRYRNGWMEMRLGYFYRFSKSGTQGSPLVSFAVLL